MLNKPRVIRWLRRTATLLFCAAAIAGAPVASAATFKVLHAFRAGTDGDNPRSQLVADSAGNLYGANYYGGLGTYNGTVYMLVRPKPPATAWGYRVIYRFSNNLNDGNGPVGALTIKGDIIYGTTHAGANPSCGCGAVFRLRPLNTAKTSWKYAIIHRFNTPATGQTPNAGVVFAPDGALYGSTIGGGSHQTGIIFRLAGSGDGIWSSFKILHHFAGSNPNNGPEGELLFNTAGNTIYGTTFGNGAYGYGTVFQMKKQTNGTWLFSTIHHFRNPYTGPPYDGALPRGRLVVGNDGGLYGTTETGRKTVIGNSGTVWRLKFGSNGKWAYSIIHQFIGGAKDGAGPKSGLLKNSGGTFYGTTSGGGARGAGVIYRLGQTTSGAWRLTVLHSFDHAGGGDAPWSALTASHGSFYGTTLQGGTGCGTGCGIVYQFTP